MSVFYVCNSCGRETMSHDRLLVCPECSSSDIEASRTEEVYDEKELEGEVLGEESFFTESLEELEGDLDL
jgi:DNA-directed RNA polymerase subunit RPC12/RpoP